MPKEGRPKGKETEGGQGQAATTHGGEGEP